MVSSRVSVLPFARCETLKGNAGGGTHACVARTLLCIDLAINNQRQYEYFHVESTISPRPLWLPL